MEGHHLVNLSREQIGEIHRNSEGLPLYLRYIAEKIRETGDVDLTLSHFPQITDGDIHVYHKTLWQEFEHQGGARYVCSLLACLRFPVSQDDLIEMQHELKPHEIEDCLRQIQHLLKRDGADAEIYHSSFKEFVLSTLSPKRLQGLYQQIADYVIPHKDNGSRYLDCWFRYGFEYAYRAQNYTYVLQTVNREFIDYALLHYRSNQDIENAISWAVEAAKATSDLLAFSRLGALKSRTNQRLQYVLSRDLLSRALLALGREEDVIRYSYSLQHNQWLVNTSTALNILKILPGHHKRDLGKWLFSIFVEAFEGKRFENTSDILDYAYCLGIYTTSHAHSLRWLSRTNWKPGIDEELLPYVPGYAPALENYIEAVVVHQSNACWRSLKKVKRLFSNQLIRYFLIRSVARHKEKQVLQAELEEYLAVFQPTSNPELACYAAFAGLPPDIVMQILGQIVLPPLNIPDQFYRNNPLLHTYRMTFIALGYEGRSEILEHISKHLGRKSSWWTGYLRYLLYVGECVGQHWARSQSDWFGSAMTAIDALYHLQRHDRNREMWTLLEVCRAELADSLFSLTNAIEDQYPERLASWFGQLQRLPNSGLWTTLYGIKEVSQNFIFELNIYERLASIPRCRKYLLTILERCAERYRESTLLKGESRSGHFLRLASIAAQCGYIPRAEVWLREGITATLIYGYHKDMTLFQLVDIMELINEFDPDAALARCADMLNMIFWLPSLTDHDEVDALPEYIFIQVVKLHKQTAFQLLHEHVQRQIIWLVKDCVQAFIKQADNVDPEILWALSAVFTDHFESAKVKGHIVNRIQQADDTEQFREFTRHLDRFIRTHVPLHRWSELHAEVWHVPDSIPSALTSQPHQQDHSSLRPKIYTLHGSPVTLEEIEALFYASFDSYKNTLEHLKVENRGFFESKLSHSALQTHITQATSITDLIEIKDYIGRWENAETMKLLADQFIEFGEIEHGLECLEFACSRTATWFYLKDNQDYLKEITNYDRQRIIAITAAESYRSLIEYSGFEVPRLAANAFYALEDGETLKRVYDDYFHYCQELFAQLPREDRYQWLKTYSAKADDWQQAAIHFLVDVLDTVDIDAGKRLVDAYRELCLTRPELALPVFIERLSTTDTLVKSRLFIILYMVSYHAPQLLLPYVDKIAEYLDVSHFQWKMVVLKLLQSVSQYGTLSEQIQRKIERAEFRYSSRITSSTFRVLHTSPSSQFVQFFMERTLKTLQRQIAACCHILDLEQEAVLAKIEQTLTHAGWTVEEAQEKLKDEWDGYVHVQGYPYVPIITSFEQQVLYSFNHLLDEIVKNTGIDREQIEALWRILQPVDPQYTFSSIRTRPEDIPPLLVSEKDRWLAELDDKHAEVIREPMTQEWLTLYEERFVSQCEEYKRYTQAVVIHSSLIKQGILPSDRLLEESWNILKLVRFHDDEFVTLQQARDYLTNHQFLPTDELIVRSSSLPVVSMKTNSPLFLGYNTVLSLPRYLIEKYGLVYRGFDLYAADECVVKYEVWQEGYEDDPYSRELLSHGTRLLIHHNLMKKIFQDDRVELCQGIFEKRLYFESKHTPEPTEQNERMEFVILHQ